MITKADIEHLAGLARIEFTEEEKETLPGEFTGILAYIDQVQKVSLEDTDSGAMPAPSDFTLVNVVRADHVSDSSPETTQTLIDAAPSHTDRHIIVQRVLGNSEE